MKTFILLFVALLSTQATQATHLLGGYIQARPVANSAFSYEITLTLYLDTVGGAAATSQAVSVSLCFGDGSIAEVSRQSLQFLGTDKTVSQGIYRVVHTYAGPGVFTIATVVPNRSAVQNIRDAVDRPFALRTTLAIPATGSNRTPALSVPETGFQVTTNQRVVLPFRSADDEGDSLTYGLKMPLAATVLNSCELRPIATYQFPNDLTRQGTFKLNNRTGDLTWDAPTQPGRYSVALTVSEYRNGTLISQTLQEITLIVVDRPGTPGVSPPYEPAIEGDATVVSGIVTALPDYRDEEVTLTVFPNPVDDRLQVVIQASTPTVASIQLLDVNGRKIHELAFRRAARQHEQVISMDSLSPGLYVLRADVGGRSLIRKVIKR